MTSICVVTMGRGNMLRQMVEGIREYAAEPYELIIVDNGSTDDPTINLLNELESSCTIIRNETNLGLSVATNQGLAAAKYDTLIHMDDDCYIYQPGWNQTLAKFLASHPDVGIVSPDRGNIGVVHHPDFTEVRWFLGIVWALRRSVYEEIGGYDEKLLHQQECDLCLRTRLHGFYAAQCPQLPASTVINLGQAPQSDLSKARENFGTVQFHDKWCHYFRGPAWSYGRTPRYLMQHFPPDQDFFARVGEANGLNSDPRTTSIDGQEYWVFEELRPDRQFTVERGSTGHEEFRQKIVDEWLRLTGEAYTGYDWGRVPYAL